MAAGDFTLFNEFSRDLGDGHYDLEGGTFKIMLNTRQSHDFTAINGEVVARQSFEIAIEDMTLN